MTRAASLFIATTVLAVLSACSDASSDGKSDDSKSDDAGSGDGGPASGGSPSGSDDAGAATGGGAASGGASTGSGGASGGGPASGGAGPALDCSKDNWSNMSDACWSCMCGACKDKLDLCNTDCTAVMECAIEKKTLVNAGADISCEIRATTAECLADPASQAVASPLVTFDTCLITAPKPSGGFRICEKECAIPYPGDVCARFPAAM